MTTLDEKEIGFMRLSEQVDTTAPGRMLVFHIFGARTLIEREMIRERTHVGLAATRALVIPEVALECAPGLWPPIFRAHV